MIYFKKTELDEYDGRRIVFKTNHDHSLVTNTTIDCLRSFFAMLAKEEINNFIDALYEITSIVRLILFENELYKQRFLSTEIHSPTYLGLVAHQQYNMKIHLNSFFQKTNLKFLIGKYITGKLRVKNPNQNEIEMLEVNGMLLLNSFMFVIFNNAAVDIKEVPNTDIPTEEYLRLFQDTLSEIFKIGWNYVSRLALSDIDCYQRNMIDLLTTIMSNVNVSTDIGKQIETMFNAHTQHKKIAA